MGGGQRISCFVPDQTPIHGAHRVHRLSFALRCYVRTPRFVKPSDDSRQLKLFLSNKCIYTKTEIEKEVKI